MLSSEYEGVTILAISLIAVICNQDLVVSEEAAFKDFVLP